jgi:hypothetical protein
MNKKLLQKVPGLNVYHAGSVAFTRLTPGDPAAQSTTVATRAQRRLLMTWGDD